MDWLLIAVQLLAVWVVVPLGLGLIDELPERRSLRRTHPVGALLATAGLVLPTGPLAAAFATGYGAWCLAAAANGAILLGRGSPRRPHTYAPAVALLSLPVAALGMVAARGGWELFGFELVMLTLTSVHFHFAGFAAALLSGLTAGAVRRRWAEVACAAALVSPALIGIGFFAGPTAQLPGVLALTVALIVLAVPTLRARPDPLRTTSALAVLAPMVLAAWWTVGLAFEVPHLSLAWTAATHGVVNALGYAVCGLLGWRRAQTADHGAGYATTPTRSGV